jgi:hypothetical protein
MLLPTPALSLYVSVYLPLIKDIETEALNGCPNILHFMYHYRSSYGFQVRGVSKPFETRLHTKFCGEF